MKFSFFLFLLFFSVSLSAADETAVRPPQPDRIDRLAHTQPGYIDNFRQNLMLLIFDQLKSVESYEKLLSCLYFLQETTTNEEARREVSQQINLLNGIGPYGEESYFSARFGREASHNVLGTPEDHEKYIRETIKKNARYLMIEAELKTALRKEDMQQIAETGRANPLSPEEMAAAVNAAISLPGMQALLQRATILTSPASPEQPRAAAPTITPDTTKNYYAPTGLAALSLCVYGYGLFKEYQEYCLEHSKRSVLKQQKSPLKNKWDFFKDRFMRFKFSLSDAARIGLVACAAATVYVYKK